MWDAEAENSPHSRAGRHDVPARIGGTSLERSTRPGEISAAGLAVYGFIVFFGLSTSRSYGPDSATNKTGDTNRIQRSLGSGATAARRPACISTAVLEEAPKLKHEVLGRGEEMFFVRRE